MDQNKVVFTSYEIKDCLFDHTRTLNLEEAINKTVKDGDIVLEAGGGTGILSMFALKAGAKHVYVIELSARFTQVIREIAKLNGFEDRITVINGDATETDIPEKVDVYISELLCTGLFNEPQVQAYNNCRRFFTPDTKCIPSQVVSKIQFVGANEYVYGINVAVDSYLAEDIPHTVKTDTSRYMHIKFNGKHVNPHINEEGTVRPLDGVKGRLNAAIITSIAQLAKGVVAEQTKFLFNPELIFFKNTDSDGVVVPDYDLCDTKWIDYKIEYIAGGDTRDIKLRVW